jgi:hypothetical protein
VAKALRKAGGRVLPCKVARDGLMLTAAKPKVKG